MGKYGKCKTENGLVFNVGLYQEGKYKGKVNYKDTREYTSWYGMLERVYSPKSLERNPTYKGCSVDDRWLNFQTFAEDVNNMIGFNEIEGKRYWDLDKDLFGKGSKKYSKENCVFLPQTINKFIANINKKKSDLPTGVDWNIDAEKYRVRTMVKGERKHLGYFTDPQKAYEVYCQARNEQAKYLAEKYKNQIDPKVYKFLMEYDEVWFDVLKLPSE